MTLKRHWRPYPVDPSCKLYLPFYKYGGEQQRIWDISGSNNHGVITGAIPGIPMGWFTDAVDYKFTLPSPLNLGTTHSLRIWMQYLGDGVILGGASNYALRFVGPNIGYNVGTVEQTEAHGLLVGDNVCIGVVRSGTSLQFYKNGIPLGTTKTLGLNNNFVFDTIGNYTAGGAQCSAMWYEIVANNVAVSPQEMRNYYELTRYRYSLQYFYDFEERYNFLHILLEDGYYLLLEDGRRIKSERRPSYILLEDGYHLLLEGLEYIKIKLEN